MKHLIAVLFLAVMSNISFAQSIPAYVSTDSLIAWYPFSGNPMNASGGGLNGRVAGAVLTTDRFGDSNSAYYFKGDTDRIAIDTTFFNIGWDNFTVSLWMNSDSVDNYHNYNNDQCMFNTNPHNGVAIEYNWGHSNKYSTQANQYPPTHSWNILSDALSNSDVSAHIWKHIVLVKRNTAYSFYINGILDTTYNTTLTPSSYFCKAVFGNIDSSVGSEGYWGKLDDYGIWNRGLALCEIKKLYDTSAYTYLTHNPRDTMGAVTTTVHFNVSDTGTGNTYQWQVNTGAGFTDLTAAAPYSGVTTNTLTISGITAIMNNNKYRCIISGAQVCVDSSVAAKLCVMGLGVNNINKSSLYLAPNPTTGIITVFGASKLNIYVYNSLGQLVKEAHNTNEISISTEPVGFYTVKLCDDKNITVFYDKMIKK